MTHPLLVVLLLLPLSVRARIVDVKVQFSIRGEELRITGAKRDVLQEVIQTIKNLEIKQPLQFINFRD